MMNVMTVAIFAGALSTASYALYATVAPNLDKVLGALRGEMAPARVAPLAALVRAERRIAVRRWAGSAAPAVALIRQRGAA
jgi:hypothetical protein